jgi:hypothetical protein
MTNTRRPVPQKRQDRRTALNRILSTPNLERVVPRLQPDLLHRVIQHFGLEDCGELVALATPGQIERIFDLDLWRPGQAGMDEEFDAERFGLWLEVLAELDPATAAQKLSEMDATLVVSGLAQHVRVFDGAAVTPYRTTDGVELKAFRNPEDGFACEVGGYRVIAKRTDSWDAIVAILISLEAEHHGYFHQVMRGCRALSNLGFETDGLNELLSDEDQVMFDLAFDRERRRDEQGYVTPAQARAFLEMSRQLRLGSDTMPPANPIARAYLRSLDQMKSAQPLVSGLPASKQPAPSADPLETDAALIDVLLEAGIIAQRPRALLNGSTQQDTAALRHIRSHMQFVLDRDHPVYIRRNEELTYIANTIMTGCAHQDRTFTPQEAWDAAVAVCNLGLENWPPLWRTVKSMPDDFLVHHDLVIVFQVGWTVLHKNVGMYAAEQLLKVLAGIRRDDCDVQSGLDALRMKLSAGFRSGMPWRARTEMEVMAMLDLPAWAALLGLIDECPVLRAALSASQNPRTRSVSASAFEFISENRQITSIHEFFQSLPETLRP